MLYPLGVGAELWVTGSALKEAYASNPLYAWFMVAVMVGYIPGASTNDRLSCQDFIRYLRIWLGKDGRC